VPMFQWNSPPERLDLERKLAACHRLVEVADQLVGLDLPVRLADASEGSESGSMSSAAFEEYGRATKTFKALIALASQGFGPQAYMLGYVVLESSLLTCWALTMNSVRLDQRAQLHARYCMQVDLIERRKHTFIRNTPDEDYLSPEEMDKAIATFGTDPVQLWTGHGSIEELGAEVASTQEDEFARESIDAWCRMASHWSRSLVRGTGLANWSHRRYLPNEVRGGVQVGVLIGPGPEEIANALHCASIGYSIATSAIVDEFAPELAQQLKSGEGFLWRAWKDPDALSGLAPDSPCPCDKPGTVWSECHGWTANLGTQSHRFITDADLIHHRPYEPNSTAAESAGNGPTLASDPPDIPDAPLIFTFTFPIPFTLGLADDGVHTLVMQSKWVDGDDSANFGPVPFVRIRLHNQVLDGNEWLPKHAGSALQHLYGCEGDNPLEEWPPIADAYEQWITMETPSGRIESDKADDPAYAFHRSLLCLNQVLAALALAFTEDIRIRPISTLEMGPVVIRGAYPLGGAWIRLGDLMMHPDAYPFPMTQASVESIRGQLDSALLDVSHGRLFTVSNLWSGRAFRAARYRGDYADGITSLQTSVESMLFDLWRGTMVDEGESHADIQAKLNSDAPYATLLKTVLPAKLGGNWQLTGSTAMAKYWRRVYEKRNKIVHSGYQPNPNEMEEAKEAFFGVRDFVSKRLWETFPKYPRTLLCKVGINGLERRGWMTNRARQICEELYAEPLPFYWPRDRASRL
jgi:hypothetical protein